MKGILRLLEFICFVALTLGATAQSVDIQLSKDIHLRPNDEYQGLIHNDDSGYLLHLYERSGRGLLDIPGRMLILEKYDKDFDRTFSYEYGEDDMVSIELFAVGNKLAWIVLEKTASYKYTYSLIPIGFDGKEGPKQKLFETEVNKAIDIPFTFLRPSPDSSKLAFIALFDANKKRRKTEVYTAIIDENASLVWDKFTTMRGNQKQYDILDYQLNDREELLLLSKYYRDEKAKNEVNDKRGDKVAGYQMYVYTISAKTKQPEKQIIDLDDAFVHDATLKVFPSGEIYSVGFTSDQHKGNISGIYVAKHDSIMQTTLIRKNEFDIKDLISLDKADADVNFKKKNNKGLDDEFELIDVFQLQNGELVITAEENFTRAQSTNIASPYGRNFRNDNNSVFLNSNDIVVIKVNTAGEMNGLNLIPKKQSQLIYRGRNYFNPSDEKMRESNLHLSHSTMVHNETLYFLYNEHRDNFSGRKRRRVADRMSRMEPAIVTINNDFSYDIRALLSENSSTLVSPTRSEQISENQYFITLVPPQTQGQLNIKIGVLNFK